MTEGSDRWVREIDVLETRFPEFEKEIAKISRKGAKMDRMPLIWNVVGHSIVHYRIAGKDQALRSFRVEVFGEDCQVDGWRPLATVDVERPEGTNETRVVIDPVGFRAGDDALIVQHDTALRARAGKCDHCNENRLRKYSVAMINEEGEVKLVGKTCMNEFTKCSFDLLGYLAYLKRTLGSWGSPLEAYVPLEEYLTIIASIVRQRGGYVSGRKAQDTGKASTMTVFNGMYCAYSLTIDKRFVAQAPTAADAQMARDTIAYVKALQPVEGSKTYTYFQNLKAMMDDVTMFPAKQAALVASSIGSYDFHVRRQAEEAARQAQAASAPVSKWVGVIGQRIKHAPVKFLSSKFLGVGDYGDRYLYRFVTLAGETLTYFSTARLQMDADKTYIVSFGVKKHDEFKGTFSTIIGRLTNHGEMK